MIRLHVYSMYSNSRGGIPKLMPGKLHGLPISIAPQHVTHVTEDESGHFRGVGLVSGAQPCVIESLEEVQAAVERALLDEWTVRGP